MNPPTNKRRSHSQPLLLFNIGQLLTLASPKNTSGPRRGSELRELGIITDGCVLCDAGEIVSVGKTRDALKDSWIRKNRRRITEIDCKGRVVLPGFVDSHTHPAFVAPRLTDFEKRIGGKSYADIADEGGGIRLSVAGVRQASESALSDRVFGALQQFARHGTTTVEAKSGYGLSVGSELKSLQAIKVAARKWPGTVIPTLLGAHVVPAEFHGKADEYVRVVCEKMIPAVADRGLATCVDVFCDRGAFTEEETLRVLRAATGSGLKLRAHISQLSRTPLEQVLSLAPLSLDHLDRVDDSDVALLTKSGTVATLIPAANYFLGLSEFPPARKLIDAGAAVALATDYNPGTSPTLNMQCVLSVACTQMRMLPAEAISAATINGAWALGMGQPKGSIAPGKDADLAIFNVRDYRELAYWFGLNLCAQTILNGHLVTS